MPEVTVKGMSCQHCVQAVTNALESIDGIANVQVDLSTGRVEFEQSGEIPEPQIRQAVQDAGYEME
ncbi:heavy-metal-associated domain-containing protein [Desulfohalobium retbaense]|uniref:Heavy metal transport/detoxification protein n=1 Tax=Desulfohalobium retbaense (strain ATCC 49708 / DSM 5692 / JCM 16813 / HR100) TaxID=485915 RepID=C8X1I6_DESRD|nr:heavy-metal-associated domain-containing protein [Desulfohalobium retbaense]ACV68283.1 Heavy metal transport/detoxification protein [Desulfohalobium retbaense DSM 5692]